MTKTSHKLTYSVLLALSTLFAAQSVMAEDAGASEPAANVSPGIDQQFLEGLNERDAGDYEASISAFQGILSSEPTLNRARAELAVSYFKSLNYAAAREQAEKVLNDPATPTGVKNNVSKFLDLINTESRTHVFTPYVNFGFGHDDNINVGPSSSIVNLGGQQLVANGLPLSKNFFLFNAGVSHRYLSPEPVKLFNRSAAYIWQSNVNYYRNDNRDSGDFDLDVLSLSTGPLAIVAERWRVGVDFTFDYILQGHSELASFYGVAPSITWNVDKNTDITLNGKYQKRDFKDDIAPGRDSDYETIGVNAGRAFFDTKLMVQVGASYFNENADTSRFSNDGYELLAGASYRAWPGGNIYAKDVYKDSQFDGKEVLFNKSRDEQENRATIGLNHRFTQAYIKDWTMDANVTYTSNDANISIYNYHRTQYSLTFGKYFQ